MMKKLETVKDELLYLSKKNKGLLSPQKVVEFAENPSTLLHSRFEWDNEKAGHEYRLWQARKIISLEFEIIENENVESKSTRLFVSLKEDRNKKGGYRIVTDVFNDDKRRKQLLAEALDELIRIKEKYKQLSELEDIFTAIDKALKDDSSKVD